MKEAGKLDRSIRESVPSLLARHGQKWYKFVLRIVESREDAEDVIQEAVRRVLGRGMRFESEDEIRRYLNRAISNTAIEVYHSRRRERLRSIPLEDNTPVYSCYPDPQSHMEIREDSLKNDWLLDLLRKELLRLPAKEYEALLLTLLDPDGASIRDIGNERGIPYSTLRHRSLKGLRRLKKYLKRAIRFRSFRLVMA